MEFRWQVCVAASARLWLAQWMEIFFGLWTLGHVSTPLTLPVITVTVAPLLPNAWSFTISSALSVRLCQTAASIVSAVPLWMSQISQKFYYPFHHVSAWLQTPDASAQQWIRQCKNSLEPTSLWICSSTTAESHWSSSLFAHLYSEQFYLEI